MENNFNNNQQYYNVQGGYGQPQQPQQKSRVAAGLLGIFLGCFGIHNFYLGYKSKALVQCLVSSITLVLGICTSWLGIGIVLLLVPSGIAIWGLVEGILILAGNIGSADGIPLRD